jgi:hypothetical protein
MRRTEIARLHRIAQICELKRLAAEAAASRAAAALHDREEKCALQGRRRHDSVEGWLAAVELPRFDIARVTAWSVSLRNEDAALRQANAEAARATRERDDRVANWRVAANRVDAVADLQHDASKEWTRYRDEVALSDAADRLLARGSGA